MQGLIAQIAVDEAEDAARRARFPAGAEVEFADVEKAIACHDSPAYQEALKTLGTGNVERDMRVLVGEA